MQPLLDCVSIARRRIEVLIWLVAALAPDQPQGMDFFFPSATQDSADAAAISVIKRLLHW